MAKIGKKEKLTWTTKRIKLGRLLEWDKNPARISERDAQALAISLDKYDHVLPYVAAAPMNGKEGLPLLDGHQRKMVELNLLKVSPDTLVDVRIPSRKLTEKERKELAVRLRKNVGEWDEEVLAQWFDSKDLIEWGFDKKELAGMGFDVEEETRDTEPEIDRAEELLKKWKVKSGDLWELGKHRLICGDCTLRENVSHLMDGEKWDIGFTSPPYNSGNADFTYDYKAKKEGGFYRDNEDDLSQGDYASLCFGALDSYLEFAGDTHALFWNVMYNANSRDAYGKIVFSERNPFMVRETIVWNKIGGFPVAGTNILSRNSELVFLLSANKKYLSNQTLRDCIYWNRWDISNANSQQREERHKACFPIELPSKALRDFSKENMILLDLFCGSGTSLVACENLNRRGRGVEHSPAYCAVTLERFYKHTGIMPKLIKK